MAKEHEEVVASALNTVEELGKLFDRLAAGNSALHKAYRTVLRVLKGNLGNEMVVAEAMETLKASVGAISIEYYGSAADIGIGQSIADLGTYGISAPGAVSDEIIDPALTATLQAVEVQAGRAIGLVQLEMDESYILGDENRQGVVRPEPIIGEMKFWIAGLAMLAYSSGVSEVAGAKKQAVAQIDKRTTRTCLSVHGQIVKEREKFHLTETPRYAGSMDAPPFHRGCRTAVALILDKYIDEKVTKKMRDEAVAQGKLPLASSMVGRAHYKVIGRRVQEFRGGRWHRYQTYKTNVEARKAAASLNEAKRS